MTNNDLEYIDAYFFYNPIVLPDNPIIVEIGSFTGKNAINLSKRFKDSTILVYEASETAFNKLSKAVKNIPNCTAVNKALTNYCGKILFHEFKGVPRSSSIYSRPKTQKEHKLIKQTLVNCTNIAGVLEDNAISHIDLLLLNCEGAEIPILQDLYDNPSIQTKVNQVCASFHDGKIYPREISLKITKELSTVYKTITNDNKKLEYVLFYRD